MLFQALDMAEAPAHIGRFEIRERLGRGGMGSVFRAFDPELQRDVALKVLDGKVDAAGADAVRQEARALARLAHPNVVGVYELGIERDQVFLAMEYVPGRTVRQRVEGPDAPDTRELIAWFVQAGRGLQAAHDAGLIHRDIKPDNLLVADDGRVRVADFGLACLADVPRPDEVAGTPTYMAPEVVGEGRASVQSDQYAFAASLWRLLDPVAPLRDAEARIPVALRDALTRALAPAPADRWPSMAALLEILAPPDDASPRARQRAVLLQRVDRLWIQGVLNASLAEGPVFDLPMSAGEAQVDAPWGPTRGEPGGTGLSSLLEAGQGSLLLLGEPGGGKTTTLLRLAETLLDEARLDPRAPAPVVLLLASLADHRGPFEAWIEQELVAKYGLPRQSVREWIANGELVLLLDGLDEIAVSRRDRCITSLNAFRETFGLPMAVTCRTSDYASLRERLRFGQAIVIDPLPPEVVATHVGTRAASDVVATLRTPLMVGLLARSDAPLPDDGAHLPWLYARYVEHQLDGSGLSAAERGEMLGALGYLADAMSRGDRTELWLEQLSPDWALHGGRRTAAKALGLGLLTACCVGANVAVGTAVEGDPFSGLLFGLCSVPMILAFNGGLRIQPVERLRFSGGRLARMLPLALGLGIVAGAIYGLFYVLWVNVFFGAVAGLVTTFIVAFEPSLQESRIRPNQGIRQSLINGLGIGALGLVLGGAALGYVAVPLVLPYLEAPSTLVGLPHPERSAAAVAGPMLGLIAGMVRGGWAVLLHVAVRAVLALSTPVPARLVPLLDRAVDVGLLRRVGGGYLFLHRTFQAYLAGSASS
ncbi:MAG: protein kinase [Alphaproteobacteria bacterium]|nr:protein kinase [Alphaproteobacteria bacterium]